MRKRLIDQSSSSDESWLDLQCLAEVELTSEDAAYPIEAALMPGAIASRRAAQAGEQTIRFLFDEPQRLKRIRLAFRKINKRARKSSSCGGRQTVGLTGRSCVSNITSVRLAERARLKTTRSISPE